MNFPASQKYLEVRGIMKNGGLANATWGWRGSVAYADRGLRDGLRWALHCPHTLQCAAGNRHGLRSGPKTLPTELYSLIPMFTLNDQEETLAKQANIWKLVTEQTQKPNCFFFSKLFLKGVFWGQCRLVSVACMSQNIFKEEFWKVLNQKRFFIISQLTWDPNDQNKLTKACFIFPFFFSSIFPSFFPSFLAPFLPCFLLVRNNKI